MNSKKAIARLQKDPVMKQLITQFGILESHVHQQDLFAEIVDSIISQQLSGKVSRIIYARFETLFSDKKVNPGALLAIGDQHLRDVGMSWAKVKYIKDLAAKTIDGTLQLESLDSLSNDDAIEHLVQVKGIGRWTAEMILMFSLNRPDVFSIGDLGLRTAVSRLYRVNREDFRKIAEISTRWKPYRSLACRYLWKSLDNE